jgi:hypothetical protein
MRAQYFFLLMIIALPIRAWGQARAGKDTVMRGATIEVIQAYKPQVKQAPKPEWMPQLPPPDTTHKAVNYDDVPQQSLYYTYTSLPLHPLAMGKDELKRPFPNYIKLGAGNLNTIYLDAGIGGLYGKNYETAIHLHHISQKGNLANQQSSLSGAEAEGTLHAARADWKGALIWERNQYYNYGYNHDLFIIPEDQLKQTYTTVRAIAETKNKVDSTDRFLYKVGVNGSLYAARDNTTENNLGFDVPLAYKIESNLQAQLAFSGSLVNLKTASQSLSNNYIQAKAGFGFNNNLFTGHALLGYALGKDNKSYFLPDIVAGYTIHKARCTIYAGIQSSLRQNTYEQLTTENPYTSNSYPVMQTSKTEYFLGVRGGVGDHFTYSARASYWDYKSLPFFLNDFGDQRLFRVDYHPYDVTAVSLKLAARYKEAEKWSAGLSGDFYRFHTAYGNFVWNEPATRIKGDFEYAPIAKLTLSAYLLLEGGIHSLDASRTLIKLNPYADLGCNAEYQVIPRLSAFLQINNLLNNKYQRWYGYQSYGINIYGGLRLKF